MSKRKFTFGKLMFNTWNKKYWHNDESKVCDGKHHAYSVRILYRPYRRGKNRCHDCGAKLGKPKLVRYAHREKLVDNIYSANHLLEVLKFKRKLMILTTNEK